MVLWLRPWQNSNAAPLARLNLHRERERKNGTNRPHICITAATISTDEGRAGPPRERQREQTAGRTADPPPILQAANGTKAPSASATATAPTATAQQHGRTTGGQTDTERREEPATPGHGETPGQQQQESKSSRPRWTFSARDQRETETETTPPPQNEERKRKQAAILPEDETETEEKAGKHLDTRKTLFLQAKKVRRERAKQCDIRTF